MIKKIIAFLALCCFIGIIVFVGYKITNKGIDIVTEAGSQTGSTALLLVQAKEKIIAEKAIISKNLDEYVGEKFSECEIQAIKRFKDLDIILETDENYDTYYVWDQEILDNLLVDVKLAENEYYIVNYMTNEVITTKGVKINDKTYYRLSEIKEVIDKNEG